MSDVFNMTDTWNAAGTTYNGIKMNVTNTASAAGSLVLNLQVDGVTLIQATKTGVLRVPDGSAALPTITGTTDVDTGFNFPASAIGFNADGNSLGILNGSNGWRLANTVVLGWVNGAANANAADCGLGRNAASVVEVNTGALGTLGDLKVRKYTADATNTAVGTTGNQTINKSTGTVNIAAAGTTVTVTNSLVSTSSIVLPVIHTNDATARITNVVPAAGSFVINIVACTAEVSIGFVVIN